MYMKHYIAWAEHQRGSRVNEVISRDCDTEDYGGGVEPVKQVLTDKGQEFCNGIMENWYMQKGIVHTKVGPRCIPIKSCGADASNAHWYG